MRSVLVSDFDGTITSVDFYTLLAERYLPDPPPDYFAEYRAGRLSHFDAMAGYFANAPTDDASLDALLRATKPDARLGEAAARLHSAGWDLIVVSAGSSWYIERILAAAGVKATVHANPGRIVAGRGLVIDRDRDSPFYCDDAGIDKPAVVRDALSRYETVAFAGDGPPDLHPALLVSPSLCFARGFLADQLARRGADFQRFERWPEIVERLTSAERAGPC